MCSKILFGYPCCLLFEIKATTAEAPSFVKYRTDVIG